MSPTDATYYHLSFEPAVRRSLRPLQIIRVTEDLEAPLRAVRAVQEGGLVAYPTDTVYGLGCSAYDDAAVLRVFAVKQRPRSEPLPVLITDQAQLADLVAAVPDVARRLIARFWPGAVTLIFRKGRHISPIVCAGGEDLAVRLPDHPIPRSLIQQAGVPIIGTSANVHGSVSPTTAQHVAYELGDQVDVILDGGRTRHGRESTVVDTTLDPPRVVREGAVPRGVIEEALH